jgi:HEAT repeat protein
VNLTNRATKGWLAAAGLALICGALVFSTACSNPKRKTVQSMTRNELLEAFAAEPDDKVRVAVVRQLATGKDKFAVSALAGALKDPAEPIQMAAAVGLGQSGMHEAAEPLFVAATDRTKGARIRRTAAVSLAKLGDLRAVDPLVAALPNPEALAALVALGQPAVPAVVQAFLLSATRAPATTALIAFGKLAVEPLIGVVRGDTTKYTRLAALKVLSEVEDERAAAVIDQALKTDELEITMATYRYMIRAGRVADQPRLINALAIAGRLDTALDFVGSGNPVLKTAGEEWARKQAMALGERRSELPPVFWGGVDPSKKR